MERWKKYAELPFAVSSIERVFGSGDRNCTVRFSDELGDVRSLDLPYVCDFRYAPGNGGVESSPVSRQVGFYGDGLYLVEDSSYMTYFEHQVTGTFPVDGIRHFVLVDVSGARMDFLALEEPVFTATDSNETNET
jgi:hypothetical protein